MKKLYCNFLQSNNPFRMRQSTFCSRACSTLTAWYHSTQNNIFSASNVQISTLPWQKPDMWSHSRSLRLATELKYTTKSQLQTWFQKDGNIHWLIRFRTVSLLHGGPCKLFAPTKCTSIMFSGITSPGKVGARFFVFKGTVTKFTKRNGGGCEITEVSLKKKCH